jgi:hypothetical protein
VLEALLGTVLVGLLFGAVGAIPLLPLLVRPLTRHPRPLVRSVARGTAMILLWGTFNVSLLAIWGAVGFTPHWLTVLIGIPFLQVLAGWVSHRVVYNKEDPT